MVAGIRVVTMIDMQAIGFKLWLANFRNMGYRVLYNIAYLDGYI
jgi:hypothetical protein